MLRVTKAAAAAAVIFVTFSSGSRGVFNER